MNYTEKCKWLATFYRKAADEVRGMQFMRASEWEDANMGPCMDSDPERWRLKPKPQKAWVVWNGENPLSVARSQAAAREIASQFNGTIQEITRPD